MNAITWTPELRFLVALGLGFLMGLERESTRGEHRTVFLGGVRTYPIVSMLGFGCAWMQSNGVAYIFPAGFLALGALAGIGYVSKVRLGHYGATTEVSMLLIFLVGALSLVADVWLAMALAIVTTVLLSEKANLESYVERLDRVGFLATLKFLLVTLIILPVLPDKGFTRFDLNPFRLWQMVILVSSIGFVGYLLSKRLGGRIGLWLSGLVGGIASSTAATIAMGRLAARHPEQSSQALRAAVTASSVMYIRVLVLIWLFNSEIAAELWWRLIALAAVGAALTLSVRSAHAASGVDDAPIVENPFELRPSLVFAGLFIMLSILTTLVTESLGDAGTIVLASIVGLVDVDPFILSVVQNPSAIRHLVGSAVIVAVMSNTIAKGVYFGVLVPGERKAVVIRYALWALLHLPVAFL